jgi:hypothetical protein
LTLLDEQQAKCQYGARKDSERMRLLQVVTWLSLDELENSASGSNAHVSVVRRAPESVLAGAEALRSRDVFLNFRIRFRALRVIAPWAALVLRHWHDAC